MSTIPRLSRSKSKSPQHSPPSSPKRKPLHERSHSETNSIAGSTSTGPPPIKDDSDPVYSSSPFPRLPSQVLNPGGRAPFIYEDNAAIQGSFENLSAGPSSLHRPKTSKSRSPTGKGKGRAKRASRASSRGSLEATRSRPGSVTGRHGRNAPRDLTRPLDEVHRPQLVRSNSRVKSMVSAIEASSIKSQSPPPTPLTPRARSRGSRPSVTSRRYEIGGREAEAIFELNAPSLSRPSDPLNFTAVADVPPVPAIEQTSEGLTEPSGNSTHPQQSTAYRIVSEEVPISASPSGPDYRPRSSSASVAPTDEFLAALIANGAHVQYPTLERPSAASLRTDTSSFRQVAPHPLQLRRQPGRSNLAVTQGSAADPSAYYDDDYLDNNRLSVVTSYEGPSTPPRQVRIDSPPSGRWTPGRWDAEMEDDVPELQTHALRNQRSYRDSWADSRSDLIRSESVTSFQSASSTGLPFYHFLNDSKTAWAKAYYRGEGVLRILTPPNVTMIRSLSARSATRTPQSVHSRSASDPTDTPDSTAYAQDVFIPRLRPFRYQQREPQRRLPPVPLRDDEDELGVVEPAAAAAYPHRQAETGPSSHNRGSWHTSDEVEEASQYQPYATREAPLPPIPPLIFPDPQNPEGPTPYLSPDRGNDDRISAWRPPSVETQSLFGTVNRQILLFCIGFCFPFAWMFAAFLPLPEMPPILRDDPEITPRPHSVQELNEAFKQQDVRRYQKARWWRVMNRAMSFLGTFVIAAIIALAIIGTR